MAFLSAPLIEEVRFATEPPLHTGRSLQLRNHRGQRPPETAQRFDALAHLRWHSLHIKGGSMAGVGYTVKNIETIAEQACMTGTILPSRSVALTLLA